MTLDVSTAMIRQAQRERERVGVHLPETRSNLFAACFHRLTITNKRCPLDDYGRRADLSQLPADISLGL